MPGLGTDKPPESARDSFLASTQNCVHHLLIPQVVLDQPLQAKRFNRVLLSFPEQHAVQELTKAAMSGVGIDGEVLSYLELAQVGLWALISHLWCVSHKPTLTLIETSHCPIHPNTDVTEVCFYTGKIKEF